MADFTTRILLENQQFKTELANCKRQISDLKNSAKNATGSDGLGGFDSMLTKIGINTNNTNGLFGVLGGVLGKLGIAFGGAQLAGQVFNEMLNNSQSLGDAVERTQKQAGAAVDYFAACLAQADFSGFLSGLSATISRAGQLADTLDELATKAQQLGVVDAKIAAKKAKAQEKYYKARTKEEKKAAVAEMKAADDEYERAHKQFGDLNLKAARQTIKTNLKGYNLSDKQIDAYFANFGTYEKIGKEAGKEYKKNKGIMDAYKAKVSSGHGVTSADTKRFNEAMKANEKLRKSERYAYYQLTEMQDNKEDSPMSQAYKNMAQYWNEEARIAQGRANTARKEAMADKYGGGGKSTGGRSTTRTSKASPVTTAPKSEEFSTDWFNQQINSMRQQLARLPIGSESYKVLQQNLKELEVDLHFRLHKDEFITNILTKNDIKKTITFEVEGLKDLEGVEGIKTNFDLMIERFKHIQKLSSIVNELGTSFAELGDSIGGTAGIAISTMGEMAATIAQTIGQVIALMIAKGEASAMALPFPANLAAGAAVIAGLASIIATIKNAASGNYADGGIIGGNTFHGDNILARVNSGEMILNQKQQSNLFHALNNGIGNGVGQVEFKISGSTLKGVLKNYDSKMSKVR